MILLERDEPLAQFLMLLHERAKELNGESEGILGDFTLNIFTTHVMSHVDEANRDGPGKFITNFPTAGGLIIFLPKHGHAARAVYVKAGEYYSFTGEARLWWRHAVLLPNPSHADIRHKTIRIEDRNDVRITWTHRQGEITQAEASKMETFWNTDSPTISKKKKMWDDATPTGEDPTDSNLQRMTVFTKRVKSQILTVKAGDRFRVLVRHGKSTAKDPPRVREYQVFAVAIITTRLGWAMKTVAFWHATLI